MYTTINLMVPTYGRALNGKLERFIRSALDTLQVSDNYKVEFSFCVNSDDKDSPVLIKLLLENTGIKYTIHETPLTDKPNLSAYWNQLYDVVTDDHIVSMVGDDMVFITTGWNKKITDKINLIQGIGIVYCDDGEDFRGTLCVNLFTTKSWIKIQGTPFMNPMFPVDEMDQCHWRINGLLKTSYYLYTVIIWHDQERFKPEEDRDECRKRNRALLPETEAKKHLSLPYERKAIASAMTNTKMLPSNQVVLSAGGRIGDVIITSVIGNMTMGETGKSVVYYTIPVYSNLLRRLSPNAKIVLAHQDQSQAWHDTTQAMMERIFNHGEICINAQFGSCENVKQFWIENSNCLNWLTDKIELRLNFSFSREYKKYLGWRYNAIHLFDPEIVLLAPDTISQVSPTVTQTMALCKKHEAVLMTKNKYPECKSFWINDVCEAIDFMVAHCREYIGFASGASWMALLSPCKKTVYFNQALFDHGAGPVEMDRAFRQAYESLCPTATIKAMTDL